MEIEKAIYNFIVARRIENCTPRTLNWYQNTLEYFLKWLKTTHNIVDVERLELVHLREWISHLQDTPSSRGEKRSDAYVASCARALLAFCHWLEEEGVIEKPISTRFKLPRVEQKFIPTFTSEDVKLLFDACDYIDKRNPKLSKALAARNRAILAVFLDTGIRLKELVGLRLCDVDRDRRLLLVHRKGNWWQQVPISWDGFKPLHEYLTKHRSYLASKAVQDDGKIRPLARKDDPVFLARDGKPLTRGGVEDLFDTLEERTGIQGKRVSPHNCRRYMATTQLAGGRSPLDVQRQMGHRTLTMTNRYASLSTEQLQQSHDLHSPLRAKGAGDSQEALGTGYWDIE
ncbi:MAG TPA: tyrosine-type recombinase/integrase [Ktedonobacteraceae bacterium]|nr:tyrosine-type recombinase/integrase [Ktedonobacteraceae bacterium]